MKFAYATATGLLSLLLSVLSAAADEPAGVAKWTVGTLEREAVVIPPSKKTDGPVPVVFVFHGHGGTMKHMEKLGFQKQWPEAVIVCPQGLPTVTGRDPEGKRAGWQQKIGDNDDRDLKFVDAMLKTVREKYKVDNSRVFATGHSNGGGFTYLLGAARPKDFAAIAPSAAGASGLRTAKEKQPLPVLHIAGEKDETVPFANQQKTVETVRKFNGCEADGKPWANVGDLTGTIYRSKDGAPVVFVEHPGTHKYPDSAPELIVRFFKEQAVEKK
ncbi:MAG: esterase [Planctomycetia bacterium]|nr:esterase [Planctomycetia bacterium]